MVDFNLIHPVDVVIEQATKSETPMRSDAREPVRRLVRKTAITLSAQVSWKETMAPSPTIGGVIETSNGYLIFKQSDLTSRSITLARGDKITKINRVEQALYIIRLTPFIHYPDQNGAAALKVFFADREPS